MSTSNPCCSSALRAAAASLALSAASQAIAAQPSVKAVVRADQPGHEVPKTLYGVFFEDINGAADGGLYPELIANRGFDWPARSLEAWKKDFRGEGAARLSLQAGFPLHPNTAQYLRMECYHPGKDLGVGVSNDGFGGISVKQGAKYALSFHARPHPGYHGGLTIRLESPKGEALASWRIQPNQWKNIQPTKASQSPLDPDELANWVKYGTDLVPSATETHAKLVVLMDAPGIVDLEFVSLYPHETWNHRPNGLRKDLVQLLKDMRPGVLRFPGGCIVEGVDLANLYDWKRTVGPVERRAPNWNLWGYWQSGGLGFFEYFQLAEDIGAEALPVLAAGMSCQFRKSEMIPVDGLQKVIQDALDLIEFANGSPETPWGKVRAEMGRKEPFNIKYLGIGNENWDAPFLDRYAVIAKAVKDKHPEIQIVSSSGAFHSGPEYDLAWRELPKIGADLIDEHYYVPQDWLYANNHRYDQFDRKGPKVYVGEYACHLPGRPNSLDAALAEAFMMTGFERNSDVVAMTSYAPLFNKIGNTQWVPDLIWFTNSQSFGTPSYYVQQMFGSNLPDRIIPTEYQTEALPLPPNGRIGIQSWLGTAEFKEIQVSKNGRNLWSADPSKGLADWSKPAEGKWEVADGVFRQTVADAQNTAICIGNSDWQDYTLTLKARKTSGAEGFIVRLRDQGNRYVHVNFGGWTNSMHGIEQNGPNPIVRIPGTIETNRWYDVKISLQGDRVNVWLDGQELFRDVVVGNPKGPSIAMVSGLDKKAGEVVVKCVNPFNVAAPMEMKIDGRQVPAGQARRITLTGQGSDVNDVQHPTRVAPTEDTFSVTGPDIRMDLKPNSLTVLRIQVK